MALVNPNIALGARLPEFQPRNALADFAQIQQIQGGRQAQELNALKMQEAQAAMQERNALRQLNPTAEDYESQLFRVSPQLGIQYRKERSAAEASAAATAASKESAKSSQATAAAARKKIFQQAQRDISGRPSDANITAHMEDVLESDLFNEQEKAEVVRNTNRLLSIPLAERGSYLASQGASAGELKPTVKSIDTGGAVNLVNVPAFGGAPTTIGTAAKTMAPGEQERLDISRSQLRTSQGQLSLAQQKFAFEKANPGFELQQTEDGSFVGINKRTLQAIPVTMGGATPTAPAAAPTAPAAAPTAPGAGMPGPRMPAPATQVIPGMTSVLDQPAPVAPVAPGSPVKGAPKNKDISVSEQQASYNIARVLNAADEIGKITKKDPKALAPGAIEAAFKSSGLEGAANVARSTNRQIVNGAQRDALDALLYLATGAAYNKEQLQGAFEAYIPSYTDDTGTREAKQARMTSLIQDAKIRAGKAWTPKMDAAMTSLTGSTGPAAAANIPAPKGVDSSLWNVMTPEERKLWQPK